MIGKKVDYIALAHEQLDQWIRGELQLSGYFIGSDVLDLGKLKPTMEKAREQWLHSQPKEIYTEPTIEIDGKQYLISDIKKLRDAKQ